MESHGGSGETESSITFDAGIGRVGLVGVSSEGTLNS